MGGDRLGEFREICVESPIAAKSKREETSPPSCPIEPRRASNGASEADAFQALVRRAHHAAGARGCLRSPGEPIPTARDGVTRDFLLAHAGQ